MSERYHYQQPKKQRRGFFKCFACHQQEIGWSTVYPTVYSLKRHIFATHLHQKGFTLRCGIDGCPIELQNQRNLSYHVATHHPGCEWVPCGEFDNGSNVGVNIPSTSEGDHAIDYPMQTSLQHDTDSSKQTHCNLHVPNVEEAEVFQTPPEIRGILETAAIDDEDVTVFKQMISLNNEQRQTKMALSLAQLKANYNLTQVAMEAVQEWTEGLLSTVTKTLIGGVKFNNLTQANASSSLDDLFELGEGMANPFHGLRSEWMLKNMLKDKLGYVEPETVILLEDLNGGGQANAHSMQYVPVLDVLKLLYKDKKFRSELSKRKPNVDGVMTDFIDGSYFKNHPLFAKNPDALQLQLYYDGFEVVNPLGSKIQKHNIGAIYFSILNLDPMYRSTLKSICLTGFVFEKDVKHPDIGWEVILRRFNSDLKTLEDGFHFTVDGEQVFVQGTIAQLALDNKAAHSIFGLQDCFYGERVCISRYCHCTSADIQVKASSNECEVRSRQSFDDDLATVELTGEPTNGIQSRCYIDSQYFHCAEAFSADIHHDVLEGLIPGMLKPILQELIRKRLFTIHQLNHRIANFEYNAQDARNRPSAITEAKLREESRSLKQYAAQYWCLLRKMPLLIGDHVPAGDEHWQLLLQLVDVVDRIMSPTVDEETLCYLEMQLLLLFKDFHRQFPNVRITPKMHYTLHYPRLMREVGPLIRHWVMRYEAKHHFFKRAAILTGNFINIAKTLAVRHQMLQVVHISQGGLLSKDVVVTHGHPEHVENLEHSAEIFRLLKESNIFVCKKVIIHGTVYKKGDAILTGFDPDGMVNVGEICHIVVSTTHTVCFIVNMFDVFGFDEHFHSWKIEKVQNPNISVTLYSSLPDHHPVGIHYSSGNCHSLYASFRYHVRCPEEL